MTITRVSCILLAYSFGIEGLFPFRYTRNTEEDSQKTAGRPRPGFSQDCDMSFVNIEMDGASMLDDKTKFYVKKPPG